MLSIVFWMLSMGPMVVLTFLGLVPLWIVAIYGAMGIGLILFRFRGIEEVRENVVPKHVSISDKPKKEEEIRLIAYRLWEDEGRLGGLDREYWLRSEAIWERKNESTTVVTSSQKELTLRIERESQRWSQYHNDLEGLLGIKTVDYTGNSVKGLELERDRVLFIAQQWDWYITGKLLDEDVFKVVGLHKSDKGKDKVYLLGKLLDGEPFLNELPREYIEKSISECNEYVPENLENLVSLLPVLVLTGVVASAAKFIVDGAKTK
jgi:hypothetical protein